MKKICQKNNCNKLISKGKYCQDHNIRICKICTYNNNINATECSMCLYNFNENKDIKNMKLKKFEEDRILKKEQEDEYNITALNDSIKNEEKEIMEAIIKSNNFIFEEKKKKILEEPNSEDVYNIKIKLPNNISLKRKFSKEANFEDIRNYLDIYFVENNIKIIDYYLVTNFPKIKYTIEDNNKKLKDTNLEKNIVLYIQNND